MNVRVLPQVKSVYVGNLPESYDEAKLRTVFEVYGKVCVSATACDRVTIGSSEKIVVTALCSDPTSAF